MCKDGQPSLFEEVREGNSDFPSSRKPLAARMRARSLKEVIGQSHILGEASLLPRLIKTGEFGSLLFYGPPGCGKTTLAEVIANETKVRFERLNAVLSNVAELRDVLRMARYRQERTLLFIDEIHRFNKAQQDLLLPDVEAGNITLIGATTHNPGFYIIPPLLSRSHLFRLEPLSEADVINVLRVAVEDTERGLGHFDLDVKVEVFEWIALFSGGDLRRALNTLETLASTVSMGGRLTRAEVERFAQERQIRYDANEDEHYDTISAFIKSMRGSDPDAALYWLAKMLVGGEDPLFIARRLVIFASEDIGLADSRALAVATSVFRACEVVGMPECELNLAHGTLFLASSPKSNSSTLALGAAKRAIMEEPLQAVPLHLRDAHSKIGKQLGHGKGYQYSHDYPENISGQKYLEKPISLYAPKRAGAEEAIAERLERWKAMRR